VKLFYKSNINDGFTEVIDDDVKELDYVTLNYL
jgi:hypothetical protein